MYAYEISGPTADPAEQERLVVVRNPNSTQAANASAYLDDITEYTPFSSFLEITSEPQAQATIEKLSEQARDGDLVYVMGGDGLLNTVAQYAGSRDAPEFSLLLSDIGNACNAYRATTHERFMGRPSAVIKNGSIEPIYPLRARIEGNGQTESWLALTILSAGAMATGAAMLEEPRHRESRWRKNPHTRLAYETYLSLCKGLPKLRSLEISDIGSDDPRLSMDIIAANAADIAKVAHFQTSITEHDFVLSAIKNGWHLPLDMPRLMSKRFPLPYDRIADGNRTVSFQLTSSHRNQQALMQFDGEPQALPAESRIQIDQPGFDDRLNRPIATVFAR